MSCGEVRVHGLDIAHAVLAKPVFKGGRTTLNKNRHSVLPNGATTEDSRERRASFLSNVESIHELFVTDTFRKIDEGEGRRLRSSSEIGACLAPRAERLRARYARRCNEFHVHWDADFQDVGGVTSFAEFLDRARDHIRFDTGELGTLFIHVVVITHEFKEERKIGGEAFDADTLHPGVLSCIDFGSAEWRIVK